MKKSIEKNPSFITPYLTLAKIYISRNQIDNAIELYSRLIKNRPDQPGPHSLVGSLYEQQQKYDLAEKHYKKALEINPDYIPAVNNLAFLYADQDKNLNTALDLARQAKERFGKVPAIMDTLGWVYYRKKFYDKRKEYEASVFSLNKALSAYLTKENDKLQQTFPHYFEKRQTDGVDYMIYIGASMRKSQELAPFHIKNMTLLQLMLACGLAWHGEKIKPELKVPLDTCHLILVNHSPLSIRFRFDEKRFDVDGAYDVRQEIIKSRLDKAMVKGGRERLTQPARIAIVYSRPDEGEQIKEHIAFLINQGKLNDDLEFLDLDEMPEVRGLKALRVGINLESETAGRIIEMKAG